VFAKILKILLHAQATHCPIFCCTQPTSLLHEIELPLSLCAYGARRGEARRGEARRRVASLDVRCPKFRDIAMVWFSRVKSRDARPALSHIKDARPALSHITLRTQIRKSDSCLVSEISEFMSCPTAPQQISDVTKYTCANPFVKATPLHRVQ